MNARFPLLPVAVALAVGLCVQAQPAIATTVYKWVDDKGVVNYTTVPPSGAQKVAAINAAPALESRFDVGDEDAYSRRARRQRDALRDIRDFDDMRLRREAEELRQAQIRHQMALSTQAANADAEYRRLAREQCLRERRVDCDYAGSAGTLAYYPVTVLTGRLRQSIQQAAPFPVTGPTLGPAPGTIAGTQALLAPRSAAPVMSAGFAARRR